VLNIHAKHPLKKKIVPLPEGHKFVNEGQRPGKSINDMRPPCKGTIQNMHEKQHEVSPGYALSGQVIFNWGSVSRASPFANEFMPYGQYTLSSQVFRQLDDNL